MRVHGPGLQLPSVPRCRLSGTLHLSLAGFQSPRACCCRIRIEFDDGDEDLVGLEGTVLFLGERAEVPAGGAGRRKQRAPQRLVGTGTSARAPEAAAAAADAWAGLGAEASKPKKRQRGLELSPYRQQLKQRKLPGGLKRRAPAGHESRATMAGAAARTVPSGAGRHGARGEQQPPPRHAGPAARAAIPSGAAPATGPAAPLSEALSHVKQRNLQEAMAAIHRVYAGHLKPQDRLLALHCLELAGIGGEALRVRRHPCRLLLSNVCHSIG